MCPLSPCTEAALIYTSFVVTQPQKLGLKRGSEAVEASDESEEDEHTKSSSRGKTRSASKADHPSGSAKKAGGAVKGLFKKPRQLAAAKAEVRIIYCIASQIHKQQ